MSLTAEATAQDYHPEWLMGPNLFMDTSLFARQTDPEQWRTASGSPSSVPGAPGDGRRLRVWDWAYGGRRQQQRDVLNAGMLLTVFPGIPLAGPELTPETFHDGGRPYPHCPAAGRPRPRCRVATTASGRTRTSVPATMPPSSGSTRRLAARTRSGTRGSALYRYANGGQRYRLGGFPDTIEEAGLFDNASSVTIFDEVPAEDDTPDYPPPE